MVRLETLLKAEKMQGALASSRAHALLADVERLRCMRDEAAIARCALHCCTLSVHRPQANAEQAHQLLPQLWNAASSHAPASGSGEADPGAFLCSC